MDKEKQCDEVLNMADHGAAQLVSCWVNNICLVQLFSHKYINENTHFDHINRSYKTSMVFVEATVITPTLLLKKIL